MAPPDMGTPKPSLAARFLQWMAEAIFRHRGWFAWPHLVLAVACVAYTMAKLEFHTQRSDLVGAEKEYHHIFMEFRKEFPTEDDIVVVVESEQAEKNRQFVERLGAKLEAETNYFGHVFYKGDLKMMGHKALLFVPEEDLRAMEKTLQEFQPFLRQFSVATNLVGLIELVNRQISHSREETNAQNLALVRALPALERIFTQAKAGLPRLGVPPSPGINALFDGGEKAEQAQYITFGNGRIYLATAQAASSKMRSMAVDR